MTPTAPAPASTNKPTPSAAKAAAALMRNTGLSADELQPGKSVRRLHVGDTKGLILTIAPNGTATWGLAYTAATGERRRVRVGPALSMDRTEAARQAANLRDKVREGVDIKVDRQEKAKAHREELAQIRASRTTVRDVVDAWLAELKRKKAAYWPRGVAMFAEPSETTLARKGVSRLTLKPVLRIMDKPAASVDSKTATAIVRAYEKRGRGGAEHFLQDVRAAWNHVLRDADLAAQMGVTQSPWVGIRVRDAAAGREDADTGEAAPSSTRAVSIEEFAQLIARWEQPRHLTTAKGAVVSAPPDRRCVLACLLIALSGQRVLQVLRARPEQFDLAAGLWHVPFSERKIRRVLQKQATRAPELLAPHVVPLPPQAVDVVRELITLSAGTGSKWLFPHFDRWGKPTKEPRSRQSFADWLHGWIERADGQPFHPRDLRRSWATWAAAAGVPWEVREKHLDHIQPGGLGNTYNRHDYLAERKAAQGEVGRRWAQALEAKRATQGNVVALAQIVQAA